jgi:O-methyltransferase involved in polyketide biosynthesis
VSQKSGIGQYVVLGAGMDTYAVRNPDSKLSILEVDPGRVNDFETTGFRI